MNHESDQEKMEVDSAVVCLLKRVVTKVREAKGRHFSEVTARRDAKSTSSFTKASHPMPASNRLTLCNLHIISVLTRRFHRTLGLLARLLGRFLTRFQVKLLAKGPIQ